MSQPQNHHWLPQFLLRPWCGSDGRVTSFRRFGGKIHHRRMSPKRLGSIKNLYSLQWPGFADPQFVEKDFMARALDDPASKVRDRLLDGRVEVLSEHERSAFAIFLVLLLTRTPEVLRRAQDQAEESWRSFYKDVSATIQSNAHRSPAEKLKLVTEDAVVQYGRDFAIKGMIEHALESKEYHAIRKFQWRVVRFPEGGLDLVIGDRPIRMWGRNNQLQHLWMPISPTALFVAGSADYVENDIVFQDQFREALAVQCIGDQFRRARIFVVARNLGRNNALLKIADMNLRMADN